MNFCIVFVRNLQAHKGKGILFDAASAAKTNLLKLIEGSKLDAEFCLELLLNMFGPNTLTKLAARKN